MRFLFFLALGFSLFSCSNDGVLEIDEKTIVLPDLKLGEAGYDSVLIRNSGKGDLYISNVYTDCSCTLIDDNEIILSPEESKYLKFSIKPTVTGFVQQMIVLNSNSKISNSEIILIRVKVHI
ncbi:DUF1573 domain-containing protein, partial [Algoriphagus sp. NF]|jgi:hypothetical protein|uniref:Ig-like domain-containing protein n=1 Tax=Algoriphagus sp. NF TaxID=2992756 RepID=UPI001064D9B2|nr:DUF1573 domain-containing protein [Algoriphagus sp. NF]MDE0561289.1 DUF1573 domain-containing protein [Algoriphagus sp. NF]